MDSKDTKGLQSRPTQAHCDCFYTKEEFILTARIPWLMNPPSTIIKDTDSKGPNSKGTKKYIYIK